MGIADVAMSIVETEGTPELKQALLRNELNVDAVTATNMYEVLEHSLEVRRRIEKGLLELSEAS